MNIEIDSHSGFCYGVKKTVKLAEDLLETGNPAYCIGEIVHNAEEVQRLKEKGLIILEQNDIENIHNASVMFRAHGETSAVRETTLANNNNLNDGTCPIVLRIQKMISEAWDQMRTVQGQVVIFGKKTHAEVIGLRGQTADATIVIETITDLDNLNFVAPISLFSQTTQSPVEYLEIQNIIRQRMSLHFPADAIPLYIKDTICRHVSKRGEHIAVFARKHDVVIFVSGKNSSNGKVLYEISKANNNNTFWISNEDEIVPKWFNKITSAGICGATSTPQWLMEAVAKKIKQAVDETTVKNI